MAFNLNLTFGPQWENVSNIRTFLTEMLSSGIVDINDAKKVATASSELVENVVKYSISGGAMIDIKKKPEKGKIFLTIKNIADSEHLDIFSTIYEQVTKGDPKEMYKQMMLRSFNDPGRSQLGLARIRYECQGEITYDISDDKEVMTGMLAAGADSRGLKILSVTVEIPVRFSEK